MKLKNFKKSHISWPVKAQIVGFATKGTVKSLVWWAKQLGYREDYLKEYIILYEYLQDCPKLSLYTRRKALDLIRAYKNPNDINTYLADMEVNR